MKHYYSNLFRFFFACLDILVLDLVHISLLFELKRLPNFYNKSYMILFMAINIIWLFCAYVTALYVNDSLQYFEKFARRSAHAFFLYLVLILFFIFIFHYNYSRLFILLDVTGFFSLLIISRLFYSWCEYYFRNNISFQKKIVIIGYNELSKKLVEYFSLNSNNILVDGYFEDYNNIRELSTFPIIGNCIDCVNYSINNNINEIYSTVPPESNAYIYDLAVLAEKNLIRFKFVPDFRLFINRNIHIDVVENVPILSLHSEPLEEITAAIKKRFLDLVTSLFVFLFVLSWLIPILGFLIKITSKGPIFFIQKRSGKNNKIFGCIKFRSLKLNFDSDVKQVTKDDNRYTIIGKFLRKTNLDELPQFINVFLGHMSVVGPRPHMIKHTQDYSALLNEYMIRHFLKPGITGWAQINGHRGEISKVEQLRKRVEHDIWYMENWSFWLDLKIIFLTLYVSVKGDKNAF